MCYGINGVVYFSDVWKFIGNFEKNVNDGEEVWIVGKGFILVKWLYFGFD